MRPIEENEIAEDGAEYFLGDEPWILVVTVQGVDLDGDPDHTVVFHFGEGQHLEINSLSWEDVVDQWSERTPSPCERGNSRD